jgi:hypothetical protein
MDTLGAGRLVEVDRRLATAMTSELGLGLSGLALDMTSFATFVDSTNDKAPTAQRGHARQRRTDLRLVGLGMVVSRDGGVPLVGYPYPVTAPDVAVSPRSSTSSSPATGHWPPTTNT